jgi:hypothetical protein
MCYVLTRSGPIARHGRRGLPGEFLFDRVRGPFPLHSELYGKVDQHVRGSGIPVMMGA